MPLPQVFLQDIKTVGRNMARHGYKLAHVVLVEVRDGILEEFQAFADAGAARYVFFYSYPGSLIVLLPSM